MLFVIFPYYPFDVFRVSNDIPVLLLISVICVFFFFIPIHVFNCCSSTVFCLFPPPHPSPPPSPVFNPPSPRSYCPCVLYNCSCKPFTLSPHYPLPSPVCSLSACSQFQYLWLHFAFLFILLIIFQLKVRSYGICPLPHSFFIHSFTK